MNGALNKMATSRNKVVQIKFDRNTLRYRADFLYGMRTVHWKWLTSIEVDGLSSCLQLNSGSISKGSSTHDAERVHAIIEDGEIIFDTDEETNFEWMLKELLDA
jgi:hypothetical protein